MYWPVGYTSKIDIERDEEVWSFSIGAPIPKDIPVAIGDGSAQHPNSTGSYGMRRCLGSLT
jgi:hypothetical protein